MDVKQLNPLFYLCTAGFMVTASLYAISPVLSLYAIDYAGASMGEIGLIASSFFLAAALTKIFFIFARDVNPFHIIFLGSFMTSITPFLLFLSKTVSALSAVRLVHGCGLALFMTGALTMPSIMTEVGGRGRAVAFYALSLSFGFMVGPGIGTLSIKVVGLRSTFITASVIAFIGFISIIALRTKMPRKKMLESKRNIVSDALEVIRAGGFKSSTFAYFAFSVVYAAMLAYIPILLNKEFGLPANMITALFFGYFTAAAFIRLFVYRLVNALGTYITMVLGMINMTLFLYILSSTNIFLLLILALLAMGLSHGIVFPSGAITVMRSVPQSNLILANSVYLLAFDMGGFVGPLIASIIVSGFNIHLALSWISIFPLAALAYIIYTLKFVNSARYTKNQKMKYFMR